MVLVALFTATLGVPLARGERERPGGARVSASSCVRSDSKSSKTSVPLVRAPLSETVGLMLRLNVLKSANRINATGDESPVPSCFVTIQEPAVEISSRRRNLRAP